MTEQELQAIEERWEKATPGPWSGSRYGSGSHDVWTAWGLPGQREWKVAEIFGNHRVENKHGNTLVIAENDAQAIAHAPTDVSALLAEVRRLNELLKSACFALDDATTCDNCGIQGVCRKVNKTCADAWRKYLESEVDK